MLTKSPTPLTIPYRIDALLTTGELMTARDGMVRLYDGDGVELTAFTIGSMRFLNEGFAKDGTARLYFSLNYFISGYPACDIYSIPTADLRNIPRN